MQFFKDVVEIVAKYYPNLLRGVGYTMLIALTGTVAGLLGHSQPSTTLDIYTHAFDKNKKTASQIMQSSLEI